MQPRLDVEPQVTLGTDVDDLEPCRAHLLEEIAEGSVGLGRVDDLTGVHVPELGEPVVMSTVSSR